MTDPVTGELTIDKQPSPAIAEYDILTPKSKGKRKRTRSNSNNFLSLRFFQWCLNVLLWEHPITPSSSNLRNQSLGFDSSYTCYESHVLFNWWWSQIIRLKLYTFIFAIVSGPKEDKEFEKGTCWGLPSKTDSCRITRVVEHNQFNHKKINPYHLFRYSGEVIM